jgi:drug/metabolite transporter (DMT)-like permease
MSAPTGAPASHRATAGPRPSTAAAALIAVTAAWGATFTVVQDAVERMPVLDFLAIRFTLAAGLMLMFRPRCLRALDRTARRQGVVLGLALGGGYLMQTFGLQYTSAAVSGFVTGMFVVFTPLIAGVVLRRHIPATAWAAVALATVGLGMISLKGTGVGYGELLTLIGAAFFAAHIVGLGEWSPGRDPYALAVVQLGTVAAMCTIGTAPNGIEPPPDAAAWVAVLVTAVLATAIAFVVQTWAQAHLNPVRAAVIMTMEPVFAGLFAVTLGGETLGGRTVIGGLLVVAAMLLVEAGPRRGAEGKVAHLEA